jgi:hypothetical protein
LERSGAVEVKIKGEQYPALHGFELIDRIRGIGHFHIVLHARRVDFLVFAGDPQAGHSHQLVFLFAYLVFRSIGIEVGQSQEKGLFLELKRAVDVDEPIDQNLPHLRSNLARQLLLLLSLN